MAFVEGTKILTDSGWENIENIAGNDKVLVRNFIGESHLIQPFAIRKIKYTGDVFRYENKYFDMSVTPDHNVDYLPTFGNYHRSKETRARVDSLAYGKKEKLYRHAKYSTDGPPNTTVIHYKDGRKPRVVVQEDWCRLVVYFLTRGNIKVETARKQLMFNIHNEQELEDLTSIFDKYGIAWSTVRGVNYIYVSARNNLISKFIRLLGSADKRKMIIPTHFIFSMPVLLQRQFVALYLQLGTSYIPTRNKYMMYSSNHRLIDSLILLAQLSGYAASRNVHQRPGDQIYGRPAKDIVYKMTIMSTQEYITMVQPKIQDYSGYVYTIDLFEGSVWVRNKHPVWMPPK